MLMYRYVHTQHMSGLHILEYGTPIWSPWLQKDIEKLNSSKIYDIFYRCLGYSFENRPSSECRNKYLNIESLTYRRRVKDMKTAYTIIFENGPFYCNEFFKFRHSYISNFVVHQPLPKTSKLCHSFGYRVTKAMNRILKNVKMSDIRHS